MLHNNDQPVESPTYTDEEQAEIDRAIEEKVMDDLYDINSDHMVDILPMVAEAWEMFIGVAHLENKLLVDMAALRLIEVIKEKLRECHE